MADALPEVDIVLAVYRPDMAALERQVSSVLAQECCAVRLHLFADGPMPQLPQIEQLAARHSAVSLVSFPENRGAATTFLEGLALVLAQTGADEAGRFFAYCDQDDVWHASKLAASLARLRATGMGCVHSDARVVDAERREIAPSLFALERRALDPDLIGLFFRNNATGMTMLFDEPLAQRVAALRHLRPRRWLHDHFTGFLAASGRGLAFCNEPLVDYVQHGGNAVGAGARGFALPSGGFLDPQGEAARQLADAGKLLRRLLLDEGLVEAARGQLLELCDLLEEKGLARLPNAMRILYRTPGVSRGIAARLLWSKLSG